MFDVLRVRRKRLADEAGVPPYVIFGDATLAEMATKLPTDEAAMLKINGVGKHKLKRFGNDFIDEIIGYMCR
jgi:ATP-dependent DNA helicase RecQ